MPFSVLLEHAEAVGQIRGRPVRASVLEASAVILVARGADRLLIPVPGSYEYDAASAAIEHLPAARRKHVQLVDTHGESLARVRQYLKPLAKQAKKWPEDSFVDFCEAFLYKVLLGERHHAGVVDGGVQAVREFVPILDPSQFSREARFRLAEVVSLICSYQPIAPEHLSYAADVAEPRSARLWDVLEVAEHHELVEASGRLGYLKRPAAGLRRLGHAIQRVLHHPKTAGLLRIAATTGDLGGAAGLAGVSASMLQALGTVGGDFRPPFLDLGPAILNIYATALREAYPGAAPPRGTIMLLETSRGGWIQPAFLSVGEEAKLEMEARSGFESRLRKAAEARVAKDRMV